MADNNQTERLLSKKDVFRCYRSWLLWNLSVQNMERMQGPAIVRMLGMVMDKLYPGDREKQKELLRQFAEASGDEGLEQKKGFFKKMKDIFKE